jgi:hypothetical protein
MIFLYCGKFAIKSVKYLKGLSMKKENTVNKKLRTPIFLCGRSIHEIWFDLKHIQYGWDKERKDYNHGPARNHYSEEDVIMIFSQLETLIRPPFVQKTNLRDVEKRMIFYVYDEGKKLKMVVDFMKNSSIVVVTIH